VEIFLIVIAIIFIVIVMMRNMGKKMRKKISDLGAVEFLMASHVAGLPISNGSPANLFACPDKLVIEFKDQKFEIENRRISNFASLNERDIEQINKNVIGRAVVGGILLGGLGAIVSGMSDIGTKNKSKMRNFFVINYIDLNGNVAVVSFENKAMNIDYFVKKFTVVVNRSKGIDSNAPVVL